jgi:translation initiation factor IF-2
MAKKRVHEIAKERGISSKEVIAVLQQAGLDVKASASSVDENDIRMAFAGSDGDDATGSDKAKGQEGTGKKRRGGRTNRGEGQSGHQDENQRAGDESSSQPDGRNSASAAQRRRRVVIDSQASRRAPSQAQQQPTRRGRGRGRRRSQWPEEPEPTGEAAQTETQSEPAAQIKSGATVKEVAESLGLSAPEVIKKLMGLGEMATLTQTLSDEVIELVASELGKTVEVVHLSEESEPEPVDSDSPEQLQERPPVVTVMGHVDHGKTSLLDTIRQTQVVAKESGGITQHIGAYQVEHGSHKITFLDTPGHQAFTAMRARGARITDIAVIVVAADDGVMPQTIEAIDHAKAAGVSVVVAVNKVDKEGSDPNRVRGELAQHGLTPAEWGGDTEFCDVSAKARTGLSELLDDIVAISELSEFRANPSAQASGTVIESRLDPGRGPVVSLLIERGTLRIGDAVVCGPHWGRVRAMQNYLGERVTSAEPGDPVEVLGFDGVPEAGERGRVVDSERRARQMAGDRASRQKAEALARRQGARISLEEVFARAQRGDLKELNLVVKADVAGSLGAIEDEIAKLPQEEVSVNVIHDGVGGINESDVMLASASDAIIVGFSVRPVQDARQTAEREGVQIRTYSVIYQVIDELRQAMQGMLEPDVVEETVATVEVRQTFRASRLGTIAGCYVTDGTVRRGANVKVVRDGKVIYDGRVSSLKRYRDDAREVHTGYECGIVVDNFADIKEDDVLEVYEKRQVERKL